MMLKVVLVSLLSIIVFYFAYQQGYTDIDSRGCPKPTKVEQAYLRTSKTKDLEPCPDADTETDRNSRNKNQNITIDKLTCPNYDNYGKLTLYKHSLPPIRRKDLNYHRSKSVLQRVFHELHHPDSPAKAEIIIGTTNTFNNLYSGHEKDENPTVRATATVNGNGNGNGNGGVKGVQGRIYSGTFSDVVNSDNPFLSCKEVYLTRSGCRESMPNKCVAVAMVPPPPPLPIPSSSLSSKDTPIHAHRHTHTYHSPYYHSHRRGNQANMKNQYTNDWPTSKEFHREADALIPILKGLDVLIKQLIGILGSPFKKDNGSGSGSGRKTAIVMVANEGVIDLVLNFICSCQKQAGNIDLSTLIVFLGQPEYIPLIESMGAKAIYHPFFGTIPKKAASSYGDNIFGKLMWLKASSVYVTHKAGYDVIFQDADLIWLRNPILHLQSSKHDVAFMDDGARSTRFTPFFVNSGFYYIKNEPSSSKYFMELMLKSGPSEIDVTHSHQAVLTRHMMEAHHLANLQIDILNTELFPSGALYHNNKTYINEIINYQKFPYVFHMCWTTNRDDKVKYFKELGFWFLPVGSNTDGTSNLECSNPASMLSWVKNEKNNHRNSDIRDKCCHVGKYFTHKPKT
jgi:hypothetical protein